MGFSFDNAVEEVSVELNVYQRVDKILNEVQVLHVFRHPTATELDTYRQKLARFKGRKARADFSGAASYLWAQTIIRVEGYNDLPKDEWKKFFLTNEIARIHTMSAVDELVAVASPEGDFEKN